MVPVAEKNAMIVSYDADDFTFKREVHSQECQQNYRRPGRLCISGPGSAYDTLPWSGLIAVKNSPSRAIACQVLALHSIWVLTLPKVDSITATEIRIPPAPPIAAFMASAAIPWDSAISAGASWYR